MAPPKSLSQAQSSQPKRQQTISSFFAPRPSPAPKAVPNPARSSDGDTTAIDKTLRAVSDGEQDLPQRKISRSSKRTIGDDESDIENQEPGTKKRRTTPPNAGAEDVDPTTKIERPAHSSHRTSKYLFSSRNDEPASDDDETRAYKIHMHERFVKKLGRPDSLAELKRRKRLIPDETAEGDDMAEDAEEEEPERKPTKGKKPGGARAKGQLTPMETQYLDIKRKHLDTVIVYQVGYKYMFYGEDARVASKELGLVCIPGKFRYDGHSSESHYSQFASASFPIARLHVHVKRLVNAGHKVGVVKQLETAALKAAGDNRNAPFVRKLTNVYTKGTYVDDTECLEVAAPANGAPPTGYLLCLTESNARGGDNDEKVHVGIVAVQPATGSIIYDEFEDGFMRSEIETRFLHIAPCEYLIVGELSSATNKLIKHLSGSKSNVFGDQARVERVEKAKTMAAQAYSHISSFYADKMQPSGDNTEDERKSIMLDKLHQLSEHVTICLSAMITHLVEFGLEHIFDLTKNFQPFSARTHMLINANTLNSLEIYRNQTDHTEKGSLLWSLDHTRTRFGKRLLRNWVGRPLLDKQSLVARAAAVEELLQPERSREVDRLTSVLSFARPDLERILTRVYYKKATRPELLTFLQTLQHIATEFSHIKAASDIPFTSPLLRTSVVALPKVGDTVVAFLDRINLQAAKTDDRYDFFLPAHETATITSHRAAITATEQDLDRYRNTAAQILGKKTVSYECVAGNEYLIEVDNSKAALSKVPASWIKVSGTKKVSRFRGPEVVRLMRERDQQREALAAACDEAYATFLGDVGDRYEEFRECILGMAVLDCAMSLADVARRPGYVKPVFVDEARVAIAKGRHPMVEQLLLEAYVPNDVVLSSGAGLGDPSALLITGPNMGGKSSYVRSVALITIMAQIGSYVPAESATLGLLDAVFTRMGAFDNMMRGESTFMVELGETADILKQAGTRSLVILDELGRGTSTHDGVAIAEGVLRELAERGVMCCFITHYQGLAKLEGQSGLEGLKNVHVKFHEQKGGNGDDEVTFLYEVGPGVAHRSYGLNVARLAMVPKKVIDVAAIKSKELETNVEKRKIQSLSKTMNQVLGSEDCDALDRLVAGIEQL